MRNTYVAASLSIAAVLCAGSASAQVIKPGLWQVYMTTPGKGTEANPMANYIARMRKEMETMDPESRAAMQETLGQLTAKGTEFTTDGFRTKECVTSADVAQLGKLIVDKDDSCTETISPIVNGQLKIERRCTQPPSSGSIVVKFQGNTAFSLEGTSTMTDPTGKPHTYKTTGSGKWLGSNCGAVKPGSADS
jgi:hypothetical protein